VLRRAPAVGELRIGLDERSAVHVHLAAADLDPVAGRPDDPLDEVSPLVLRVLEHDDVAPVRAAEARHVPRGERHLRTEEEFVHEDVVADEQRVHHRAGRDREGLDHERPDDEGEEDRDPDRLHVLAQRRLPLGLRRFGDALGRGRRRDGHTDLRGLDLDLALVHAQLFRTERNASCGTSTRPTCFMRLFPSFWRSRSLRFRVLSPPWQLAVTFLPIAFTVSARGTSDWMCPRGACYSSAWCWPRLSWPTLSTAVMTSLGTKTDDATYGSFISAIRSGVGSFDGFSMSSTSPAVVRIRYRTLGAVTINERSNSRSSRSWTISMCSVPRNPQRNP